MKRVGIFAFLAVLVVLVFAFAFQRIRPVWYGDLLFDTCLIFGAVGLIAGFACGYLARHTSAYTIVLGTDSQGKTAPEWLKNFNPYITSPTDSTSSRRGGAAKPISGQKESQRIGDIRRAQSLNKPGS